MTTDKPRTKPDCLNGYGDGPTHCTLVVGHAGDCNHRQRPRHTCDTARSGSERSENTCAACQDERPPCPDYTAMWLAQVRR